MGASAKTAAESGRLTNRTALMPGADSVVSCRRPRRSASLCAAARAAAVAAGSTSISPSAALRTKSCTRARASRISRALRWSSVEVVRAQNASAQHRLVDAHHTGRAHLGDEGRKDFEVGSDVRLGIWPQGAREDQSIQLAVKIGCEIMWGGSP